MDNTTVWLVLGICLAVITVFGCVGNILSFLIWTKGKRCSNCQGAIYLRVLALSDTLVLCVPAMELTIALLEPTILLRNLNPVFCKIVPISPYFCVQLSAWIVVSLTVEQTIAVCSPLKSMTSSSKWRQYCIVIVITLVSFLDNVPLLIGFYWGVEKVALSTPSSLNRSSLSDFLNDSLYIDRNDTSGTTNNVRFEVTNGEQKYTCINSFSSPEHVYIVQLGVIAIIPIVTLTVCNVIIITKLFHRDKKLTRLASRKTGQKGSSLLAAMTARTIAISIVQCVTAIPIVAMDIFLLFHTGDSAIMVIYDICNTVYYLNNAINVIFYCLLGRSFRQDFIDMFSRKPKYGLRSGLAGLATLETISSSVM